MTLSPRNDVAVFG